MRKFETYGDKIRYYRNKKGLTQRQLADMIGISNRISISHWENNQSQPSIQMVERIHKVLDMPF